MANTRCCTSQLYAPIRTWKRYSNSTTQAADLAFQTVGVAGFEPTASSSRTRVERDDEYQRVPPRARGSLRRMFW
jgi:hypothetical protein